jgi:hypothetical protein
MKIQLVIFFLLASSAFPLFAQNKMHDAKDAQSKQIKPIYVGQANMQSDPLDFVPKIEGIGVDHKSEGDSTMQIILEKTKIKLDALGKNWKGFAGAIAETINSNADLSNTNLESSKDSKEKKIRSAGTPIFVNGFTANTTSSSPPDNTVAVNTLGHTVSLINSNLRIYNTTGGSLYYKSLYSFFNLFLVPGQDTFVNDLCDPKILFDCENKRFIAFVMTCDAVASNSKIMFAFSKEENPLNGWNVYTFEADQFNVGAWFDHPRLGINGFDVFVSGNMFNNSMQYVETNVYQVDKMAAYAGNATPASWAYHNLSSNPYTPTFASDAACGNTGDKMNFISTSSGGSIKLKMYSLSGKANAGVSPTIAYQSITVPSYSPPGYSPQPNTSILLRTGDCRGHDAFTLNGKIHFAFHTDAGGGYAGIYYTKLEKVGTIWSAAKTKIFGAVNSDWAYPSLAHFGWGPGDETILVTYLSSSNTEYGSMRAVTMDANLDPSLSLLVKSGIDYINYIPSTNGGFTTCRWGDYSGSSRIPGYGMPSAWFSGMYGNTNNNWTNYICKLNRDWDIANGVNDINNKATDAIKIFPNPVVNKIWNMEIKVAQNTFATFMLVNMNGAQTTKLYDGIISKGINTFSFDTANLAQGIYFVEIIVDNKILESRKLIIKN